jgi:hypothetical protein
MPSAKAAAPSPTERAYPLTVPWLLLGGLVAMAITVTADDVLPGYAAFVLMATIGLTWRRDDPPVFPFIMAYQWLSITVGYWFEKVAGYYPGTYRPGDVEHTMLVALTGLLLLAGGIRLVYHGLTTWFGRRRDGRQQARPPTWEVGNLHVLFVVVVVAYGLDYLWQVNTRGFIGFNVALQRVLDMRQVLLVTLWVEILRRRTHYSLLWLSLGWAFVSRLGGYYSDFKSPLLLLLIVYAATFKPWESRWWPKSLLAFAKLSPALAVLLVLLLIWQGGLKGDTRERIDAGAVASPTERMAQFVEGVTKELPHLRDDPRPYVEALVSRLWYLTFFSLVLDHVPDRERHAEGELLNLAVANSTMPRFLFPDKPVLESDSAYTRRFAGVQVAEGSTSISIGYMAEFYADWGFRGMWLSVFGYGCWIGLAAALLRRLNRMPVLHAGLLVVAMLAVADFEHQFVKGFAALNASVGFMLVLIFVLRPLLVRLLDVRERGTEPAFDAALDGAGSRASPSALGG